MCRVHLQCVKCAPHAPNASSVQSEKCSAFIKKTCLGMVAEFSRGVVPDCNRRLPVDLCPGPTCDDQFTCPQVLRKGGDGGSGAKLGFLGKPGVAKTPCSGETCTILILMISN